MDDLLKVLSNPTNQAILAHLQAEPSYARRAATMLDLPDAEVTRRLRQMQELGLVRSEWSYIGKNVKMYHLNAKSVSVNFGEGGVKVSLEDEQGARPAAVLSKWEPHVPLPDDLVGRAQELAILEKGGVVLVEGLAGMGKTALVATFARQRPLDHVFWHTFRGIESLNWLAHRAAVFLAHHGDHAMLDAIDGGAPMVERRQALLDAMADPSFLWVFDDVHWIEDPIVRTFLSDAVATVDNGNLILMSRHAIPHAPNLDHVQTIDLGGLDDEAVRELLHGDDEDVDDDVLQGLHERLGGHPLALHLAAVAAHRAGKHVPDILDELPDHDLHDYLLREVHAGLTEAQRRLLATACVFRTTWTLADLQAVQPKVREAEFTTLRRDHLVQEAGGGFRLHEIIHTFFYSLLDDAGPLHKKVAQMYLEREGLEARIEAMHHLLAADQRTAVLELLEDNVDLHEFDFVDAGYQNLYLSLLDMFLEEEVDNPRTWALMEDERGDIRFYRGDFEGALVHYRRAKEYFDAHPEGDEDEDLAWKTAMALAELGRRDEARQMCESSLATAPESGLVRTRLEELVADLES